MGFLLVLAVLVAAAASKGKPKEATGAESYVDVRNHRWLLYPPGTRVPIEPGSSSWVTYGGWFGRTDPYLRGGSAEEATKAALVAQIDRLATVIPLT